MASKTVRVYTSDLSGKEIPNKDELAEIRVLDHPDIDRPVKLDAYVLEVQSLLDADGQFVTLELALPGQHSRKIVVTADVFAGLFSTDVGEVLAGAEAVDSAAPETRSRRERSASAPKAPKSGSMSREQRGAVRAWANNNGFQVGDRGRIKTEVLDAFEAAHAG